MVLAGLLMLAGVVYGYRLGDGGLTNTEGHRVAPAWQMLDSGDFLTQRLFGQAYFRKPPGHSWVIALASTVLGRNEWGARAVGALSAGGMVALAYLFARRWFGPAAGWTAGLTQLLLPIFWKYQRTAEIEGLLTFLSQLVMLSLIELTLSPRPLRPWARRGIVLVATFAFTLGVLAKGPAILPVLLAAIGAAGLVGGWSTLRQQRAWWLIPLVGSILSMLVLGGIALWVRTHHEEAVVERVFGFRWSWSILVGMLLLFPRCLVQGMPASLALVVPWLRPASDPATKIARALTLTALLAVSIYSAVGLTNERYALPAVTVFSLVAGYTWREVVHGLAGTNWFPLARQARLGTLLLLGMGWVGYLFWMEPNIRGQSGREAGYRLAEKLPPKAEIWADGVIDARPEVLLYAQQAARRAGKQVDVRWKQGVGGQGEFPSPGSFVLLRTDDRLPREKSLAETSSLLTPISSGHVYKYTYQLMRVTSDQERIETAGRPPAPHW
jgi:hypothetical protein